MSSAQAKQAPSTASAGHAVPKLASPGQASSVAPATMATMPSAMRRSKFSWKANQASNAVNTPSAFSNNEAPEAGMLARPNISSTGPTIPPATMAPASQPHSPRARRTGAERWKNRISDRPRPAPR
ncbi:MAG: hypothetical protein Q8O25_11890 [Sulfurisoma sp.]|nr:hypothetical protein [Sulfurisoma sp.]